MEEQGITQTDALLRSADALHGILAAYAEPGEFGKIVLAFPVINNGSQTAAGTLRGSAKHILDIHAARKASTAKTSFKDDFGGNPKPIMGKTPGSLADAASVVFSSQAGLLHGLSQKEGAPMVALVAGVGDPICSPERYLRELQSAGDVNVILVTGGKHGIGYDRQILAQASGLFGVMSDERFDRALPLRDRILFSEGVSQDYAEKLYALADELEAHR